MVIAPTYWHQVVTVSEGPLHPKNAEQKLARKMNSKAQKHFVVGPILMCTYEVSLESGCKPYGKTIKASTNEAVNIAHEVSTTGSKGQASSSTYADDVMFSFFANQTNSLQLGNEDLEQIDIDDLEEMDLKWQVAMLTMRVKRFLQKTRRNLNFNGKETVGFDKTKAKEDITNFALMAYTSQGSSSSSSSDSETNPFGSCPIALLSISNICVASTPAITGKVPYLVSLVALLGAQAIMVKMALGALGQVSPIGFLLTSPHIVDLGYILLLEGLLLVSMVVFLDVSSAFLLLSDFSQ
ncbi:hypothetical protein Tco_0404914 [Tanacetum coccineum]